MRIYVFILPLDSLILDKEEGNPPPLCKLMDGFLTLISMFPNAIPLPDMTDLLDRGPFEL